MAETRQRFLCFEYLPCSLDKYIQGSLGGHEWRTSFQIIKGICEGLHYLHQQNIVHLDLKPANILLDHYMVPKIADFGLSKCFDENQTRAMTSNPLGTLGYMAPESYGGLITFKTDIYSLGIIIIEILTGNKGCPVIDNVLESWSIKFETSPGDTQLEPVRVCAEIGIECTDFNPAKRPDTRRILERLDEMESICGVSEIVDEVQLFFVSEAPSPLQRITSRAPMGLRVTSTELLDIHPLELRFLWELNQDVIISPVTLTNWTDHQVGVWITPTSPDTWENICHPVSAPALPSDRISSFFKMIEPHSTVAIPMTASYSPGRNNHPPARDTGTFEVVMVVMGSKKDNFESLKQSISGRLDIDLLNRVEALGGEVHQAMLKATICDPASYEPVVIYNDFRDACICCNALTHGDVGTLLHRIHGIDVHPTEPWVLVNATEFSFDSPRLPKRNVFMWNYLMKITYWLSHFNSDQEVHVAKFIAQEWFATGDSDGYVTVYPNDRRDDAITRFSPHQGNPVRVLAVHPTYPFLLTSSSNDSSIRLWDWVQGWKCTQMFDQREDPYSIIWNPLDDTFACTSATSLKVWEVGNSKEDIKVQSFWNLFPLSKKEIRCSDPITTLKVEPKADYCCFGGDSHRNFMVTCGKWDSDRSCVRIWDIATKESVHKLFVGPNEDICGVAWHPTLPILATSHPWSSRTTTICLWDARTYRLEKIFQLKGTPNEQCMVFIGTKDLPRLVVGVQHGIAILEINVPTFLKAELGDGEGN